MTVIGSACDPGPEPEPEPERDDASSFVDSAARTVSVPAPELDSVPDVSVAPFFRLVLPPLMPSKLRRNVSFILRRRSSISDSVVSIGPRCGDVDSCAAAVVGEVAIGPAVLGEAERGDVGPAVGELVI
jgi:hypothetical protein